VPGSFDKVIINKRKGPVAVELARKQVAKLQKVAVKPRKQITSRPGLWSDHISVEAAVRKINGALLRCATWNVADPKYFKNYNVCADWGFEDFDETLRQAKVREQVQLLLSRSDCVAL
jgi:N-acetylglutamate synthase-like GNAT family acetyltransferase